jgi:hypothetical protein
VTFCSHLRNFFSYLPTDLCKLRQFFRRKFYDHVWF